MNPHQWTRPRVMVVSRCTESYGPSKGGADVLAQRHAVLLAQDADVVYVGTRPLQSEHVQNLAVRARDLVRPSGGWAAYLVNEGFHVVQGAGTALRGERQFPVDLIVSNSSISTILLKLLGRRPVVHYIHDALYVRPDRPAGSAAHHFGSYLLHGVLEKLAIRLADKVICASQGIASQAVSAGTPESKLTVMYPILRQLERVGPTPNTPLQLLPVPLRYLEPYLLSVGQQTGRKRFDVLIQTLRLLPEQYRLVLVGDGPFHDSYRALAVARGLSSRVVFLRGVHDDLLDALYQHCAAYVLASENEGFPITVAEALMRGRPAVLACPSAAGLRDALANDYLRVLTNLAEPELAAAILEAVDRQGANPETSRRTILAWATQAFPSEDQIRREYDRIIRSLLEIDPSPPGAMAGT
jgi:glycosyltransferase involved in cell wall biosynthesis